MIELWAALRRVTMVLDSEGIPYMVVGGIANLAWGEARTTRDLDLTVDISSPGLEGFLAVAGRCGPPLAGDPRQVAERGRLVPIRTPQGVRVDFMLATFPFELDAIAGARVVSVEGEDVRVCSPDHLVVMKSVSSRPQDHVDVEGILRRQRERLDLARLDTTIEGIAEDLAEPDIAERWHAAKRAAGLE